ncbi:uncharacterized protein L969DRAFT_66775 [Mixia osmundae IAM 14324]|uniref:Mitochondrial distribution and morphology protein 34 n=1 Tax=Mixia osmundae (strain CBS 9802 / IAM 14324 / JCM 22182 / KY 12970) TaxID=764103 RepID=G7E2A3_MIXOS|nr:uncharacterized protein L969DRAFT_66775 [Mixia osmundae IAM 14324]KEI36836.1 hypothetical protein L969DRAFT_66775 [Mixia osmundae IAM 14324]GAA96963.1 hypothetical protein E5Q_03637 [Mixia osmundae IAM 14324]
MAFAFQWPAFSEGFYADARQLLHQALNKGQKPPIIADVINVKELHMGSVPPDLDVLEIGDLAMDRFRGIFKLTYAGDAYIELETKIQANPLPHQTKPTLDLLPTPAILFASAPLIVPMKLRLSDLKLHAIIILVISKQKGITLVFKTDPLQSVKVSSTFDSVGAIQGFIQREIEGQLREMFRSDLPSIIHKLSQRWLSEGVISASGGKAGVRRNFEPTAKIQTHVAYRNRPRDASEEQDTPVEAAEPVKQPSRKPAESATRSYDADSVPDALENYDPTYGMRDDAISTVGAFGGLGKIAQEGRAHGLGDIVDDDSRSTTALADAMSSIELDASSDKGQDRLVWERIPAVGGGTITRPRVFHTQSQMRLEPSHARSSTASDDASTVAANVGSPPKRPQMRANASTSDARSFRDFEQPFLRPPMSVYSQTSFSRPPSYRSHSALGRADPRSFVDRARSYSPSGSASSQGTAAPAPASEADYESHGIVLRSEGKEAIILDSKESDSLAQISLLKVSNNTLSPFTRKPEHFTARSAPFVPGQSGEGLRSADLMPIRATRKRLHRMGNKSQTRRAAPVTPDRDATESEYFA